MIKQILGVITMALMATACGNPSPGEIARVDTPGTGPSSEVRPSPAAPHTMDLTEAEWKDDSVFVDGSIPSSWGNAGFDDPIASKRFLKKLKYWVEKEEKDSVANAIRFPLPRSAKTRKEFLENYDRIINQKVKSALASQPLQAIFRNAKGAMIGKGEMWFAPAAQGGTIIAINSGE